MVELNEQTNELAIIMEFNYDDLSPEFIPCKVIEGIYNTYDGIFISLDDKTLYSHINDTLIFNDLPLYDKVKFYASRRPITELLEEYPDKTLDEIKEILLEESLKYRYNIFRTIDSQDNERITTFKTNKENEVLNYFVDADSERIAIIQKDLETTDKLLEELQNKEKIEKEEKDLEEDESAKIFITDNHNYLFNTKELSDKIKQQVLGQDEAIDKIVQAIWSNYFDLGEEEFNKENILVLGSSGVGKTEIFRRIAKELPNIVVHIADLSSTTQTGIVGGSVDDIIKGLVTKCIEYKNNAAYINKSKLDHAIVVLDEFDKISIKHSNTDVGNRPVQDELLKIIEGKEIIMPITLEPCLPPIQVAIDTSKITFACCGAFEGINKNTTKNIGIGQDISKNNSVKDFNDVTDEDIKKYGFINELIARLPVLVKLNDLSLDTLIEIAKTSNKSLLRKKIMILKTLVENVEVQNSLYEELARQALKKKMGARGIDKVSSDLFTSIINEVSNTQITYEYAKLDEETVKNPKKYVLKPKRNE